MHNTNPKRQTGAILLISLIILLVMTIVGIAAMSSVTLEGKMANNARNQKIAFQSAESALRVGEAWLLQKNEMPDPKGSNCEENCGYVWTRDGFYTQNDTNSYTRDDIWLTKVENEDKTGPGVTEVTTRDGNEEKPVLPESRAPARYVIEYVDVSRDAMTLGQQQDIAPNVTKLHYQVIARGFGGDTRARSHLISALARRY